ncbi:hypothetical protein ABK040_004128 [Willaertia magna]
MSAALKSRVHRASLLKKVAKAEDLIPLFQNGQYLGWSGFTGVGYPKEIPVALANHVEKNNLQGKLKFNLFVGASTGAETENRWAKLDMIDHRYPHQVGKDIQKGINEGRIRFSDQHLSMFPQNLMYGFYTKDKTTGEPGKLDYTIVEATEIMEDGSLVLGASVGATPELVSQASKIIIEVNTKLPSFYGLHDVVHHVDPPLRLPYLVNRVDSRIGQPTLSIDTDKVVAIIESQKPDNTGPNAPEDDTTLRIANNLIDFLKSEVSAKRLPKHLLPLQSGIGNISNAIIGGMAKAEGFEHITVFTEVLQDTFLDFFDQGKLDFASATSIRLSPEGFEKFYANWDKYTRDKILLRPQQVSNAPEIIRRLGVIAMNTPVELDIYGHANSTLVNASRMINGLGGSADFLRNAKLSIMHTPSARPSKTDPTGISCIVPMCSHVDHTEHDLDVFVTEQGVADLRGLSPRDRAREIINKCAHPDYKPMLTEYLRLAEQICLKKGAGHEPHLLHAVFKMHLNLEKNGTMKVDNWN